MDFTREPIIETVITPKDGYQLVIRNSKSGGSEHVVDAVEVISFGTTYFLRSLDKPAAFLLPFAEYEVVEKKAARPTLKKPQVQKSIKIETKDKNTPQEDVDSDLEMEKEKKEETKSSEKSKSSRRKKAATKKAEKVKAEKQEDSETSEESSEKEKSAPRSLLPPPTTLISDQILRYKDYLQTEEAAPLPEEPKETTAAEEVEGILLPTAEPAVSEDLTSVEVPLSVMKEADDFINQAQDEMFNQSLEESEASGKEEKEPAALKLNCTTPPPLIMDQEETKS